MYKIIYNPLMYMCHSINTIMIIIIIMYYVWKKNAVSWIKIIIQALGRCKINIPLMRIITTIVPNILCLYIYNEIIIFFKYQLLKYD